MRNTEHFPTDITVSGIAERNGRFLCIEEVTRHGVVVNLPGGHIESGESAEQAITREVMEETRWHFEPQAFVGAYLWLDFEREQRNIRLVYCGRATTEDPAAVLDAGILSVHWRGRDALAADAERLRAPVVLSAIDDYLAGRREQLIVPSEAEGRDWQRTISSLATPL
ncbi:MAG: NUDIX domain-containing protein [Pseudomonadota bacterium]